jgi:5-(carboxyamino)imidazole ribonucleotide synthase
MLNWVGELPVRDLILREPIAHWHDYGKAPRAGRKVGHATLVAADTGALDAVLARLARTLAREAQIAPLRAALAS